MRAFVGVTDGDWFELLSGQPSLDEVNFWQPGGSRAFKALQPGELFLFKLHSPDDFVVGGGVFAHATLLPVSLAWDAFGISNGAHSLEEMRLRIERYRRRPTQVGEDYTIGCILLEQPFFLPRRRWVPIPADWSRNIVQGKGYELLDQPGASLWEAVRNALSLTEGEQPGLAAEPNAPRYGTPTLVAPRLGQGSFRVLVTDVYARRCAVTGERVLPVLEAAHIRPFARGGEHRVDNGMLLRSDIHTLLDRGYLTVTPSYRLEVSRRIREDFENGRHYYALHGNPLSLPEDRAKRPSTEFLTWHNEQAYLG